MFAVGTLGEALLEHLHVGANAPHPGEPALEQGFRQDVEVVGHDASGQHPQAGDRHFNSSGGGAAAERVIVTPSQVPRPQ